MQDIRPELRERIKQVQDKREALQRELAELETIEQGLQTVLNSENELWKRLAPAPSLFQQSSGNGDEPGIDSSTLPALLLEYLRDGKEWSLEDFKIELHSRDYPFGEKAPGRAINFALVGLLNHKEVVKLNDGRWRIKN